MRRVLPILLLAMSAIAARADDWPQWRGVNRDGRSAETDLLKTWPDEGPPLAWKVNHVGAGYSAPSIANGKIYLMGNGTGDQRHKEWVVCLDERSGAQVWACATGLIRHNGGGYPGPRSTPTVADGRVYALGLAGRLLCCNAETGQPIWFRELTRDFGATAPRYGYSESLLVDGDRVICTPGGQKTVVALNAATGAELWSANAGDPASYSSPIKATFAEIDQYVVFTEKALLGIAAENGAVLWRYTDPSNGQVNCPTPLVVGQTVFAASGYGRGGACGWVQKDKEGAFSVKPLYFTNKMQNQYGGYVFVDGFLYGSSDPGVLVALNYKTGVVARADRTGRFAIAYADGMLYLRGEDGRVDLYPASATQRTRAGTLEQPDRSETRAWTHPVIANGRLYLRDQHLLLSYDIRAKQSPEAAAAEK
jgi:outer membrane protein assembly factor BamB